MAKKKAIPWIKIKAEYLSGVTPKEIGDKYNLTAKQVSDKANKEGWVTEKSKISENMRENAEEQIKKITDLALKRLEDVLNSEYIKNSDLISAIGKAFDISGLKKSENKLTGGDITVTINRKPVEVERD